MAKRKVEPGDVINGWTVIREVAPTVYNKKGDKTETRRRFVFSCPRCKREWVRFIADITQRGNSACKECNCLVVEVGTRKGKLCAVDVQARNSSGKLRIRTLCDCGKENLMFPANFLTATSCGCVRKERGAKHTSWQGVGELAASHWSKIKSNARVRALTIDVTMQEVWLLFLAQGAKCALSGETLTLNANGRTASLDRIDSTKGYVEGNIQWVHKDVNRMKADLPEAVFFEWCQRITTHREDSSVKCLTSATDPIL